MKYFTVLKVSQSVNGRIFYFTAHPSHLVISLSLSLSLSFPPNLFLFPFFSLSHKHAPLFLSYSIYITHFYSQLLLSILLLALPFTKSLIQFN